MKQLPNLLKQESLSAHVYISVLIRLYTEEGKLLGLPTVKGDGSKLVDQLKLKTTIGNFHQLLLRPIHNILTHRNLNTLLLPRIPS